MARINLLPWRAERRKQRQREFYGMLGFAAIAGVVLSGLFWFFYSQQISGQQERNAFLESEIAKVKEQNKEIERLDKQKDRLLARKKVIEELQGKRSQMVHLFDSLVRTIPDGVVLTALKQEGETLTLEGRTQSNARVSTYMRNLEGSGWMSNPELTIIEARAQETGGKVIDVKSLPYVFTLKVQLPSPSDPANPQDEVVVAPAAGAAAPVAAPAAPAPAVAPVATPPAAPAAQPADKVAPAQKEARS
ncbi:PilN domain-containing protein [Stenotrophomonas sp.]|uniref:PilN domain-containing protein n=1 Tax=Stenotrophomonas sp. TaxID=69392 RepID=UPI0028AEB2C4|nr:PilN domain-containing protein [Stenotrophomonas sp.]